MAHHHYASETQIDIVNHARETVRDSVRESARGGQQQFQLIAKAKHKTRQEEIHPND